jgi:hypothetical protein
MILNHTNKNIPVKVNSAQCNKDLSLTTAAGFIRFVSLSTVMIMITHPSQRDATL